MKALASCHSRRHTRFAPTRPLLLGHGPDRRHARRLGLVVCSFGISRGVRVEGVVLLRKATRRFGTVVASILAQERKASNPGTNVQGPGRWESRPRKRKTQARVTRRQTFLQRKDVSQPARPGEGPRLAQETHRSTTAIAGLFLRSTNNCLRYMPSILIP